MPDFVFETAARRSGHAVVAGIDEAGRGPWAGPVVAAAVVLEPARLTAELREGIDDSKVIERRRRERLFAALCRCPGVAVGLGIAEAAEIDALNILEATMRAMARAVAALPARIDLALVDGNRAPMLSCPVRCVVKGDRSSLSIAAASIVAKVRRDRMMAELAAGFPGYGWHRNAGYGTAEHRAALARLGVTAQHRRSFAPVRAALVATRA